MSIKRSIAIGTGITVATYLLATTVKKKKFDISDIEKQWSVDGVYTPKPTKSRQFVQSILHYKTKDEKNPKENYYEKK